MKVVSWGLTVLAVSCALLGCKDDCADAAAAADKFLADPQNLSCESNEDCTVVFTGCAPVTNAFCGQSALSTAAAESAAWSNIKKDLQSCDDCGATCAARLLIGCNAGKCGR